MGKIKAKCTKGKKNHLIQAHTLYTLYCIEGKPPCIQDMHMTIKKNVKWSTEYVKIKGERKK